MGAPGERPGRSLGGRLCVNGAGGRRLGCVSGRGAASEWPGRRACPVPGLHTFWVRSEVALPSDGSEKRSARGLGVGIVELSTPTRCPPARHSVQVPRPHATGTESRPPWPSTYLAGWASPGTKVSWDQSRALTSMPPSTAEGAPPRGHSEHLAGGSISTSGDKTGLPECSGASEGKCQNGKTGQLFTESLLGG